jgi:hypothetical protein
MNDGRAFLTFNANDNYNRDALPLQIDVSPTAERGTRGSIRSSRFRPVSNAYVSIADPS